MTLPPINQPPTSMRDDEQKLTPKQGMLEQADLEALADALISMLKRELRLNNEREGRHS